MPDKDGDDEKKSTKSVVNKKQKQMMGEEGYDIARDMGRVRPSKDKKDATTMPVSKEMKKTQKVNKGPSALELVKKKYKGQIMDVGKKKANEELDLTQVAEAFGGYIVEGKPKIIKKDGKTIIAPGEGEVEKEKELLGKLTSDREVRAQKERESLRKGMPSGTGERPIDQSTKTGMGVELGREQQYNRPKSDRSDEARKSYNQQARELRRQRVRDERAEKLKDPKFRASETLRKAKPTDIKGGPSVRRGKPVKVSTSPVKKKPVPEIGGFQPNTFKDSVVRNKKTSKQIRSTETLRTAKQTDIKGGSSVRRGDPVKVSTPPVKKKPVPEIGGTQFNTFSDKEMKKRKTFKQAFGRPTGADPKTGKPTYVAPGVVTGKPRKSLPRSKNLPNYQQTKDAINIGLNPDETDKNKFIKKDVRIKRMKDLGTPDPFKVDTSQASKEVAKQFGTKPVKGGLDFGEPTVPKKVKTQTALTGKDFKRFRKQSDQARRIKVGQDIDKKIAQVAKKNVSKAKIATPVVKTLGKETGEAAVKTAGKRALKRAGAKALAKQIPGVGSFVAGGEAAARAAKGDLTGAALSIGQAIPGVSIPLAAVDVAREVKRAKGGAKVGQKVATQVARSLPGSGKKVGTGARVVNPTVVGSFADRSRQFRKAMKDPKKMGAAMAVGSVGGKGLESGSRATFKRIKPPAVKGGRAGRRSAKS